MSIAQNFPTIAPALSLDFANVQALDPRISFSRATTATYYGTRTALAEQNLALYSQEFDQATWSKGAVTVTANSTAAPDGTTTADTVIPTATTATHQISSNTSIAGIGVNTLSVYAKATGYSYVQLMWGSGTDYANFFLSGAGSVSQNSGGSPTITSVGNDWYRCSITTTLTVASAIYFLPMQTGTETRFAATTGDGTSGVFLWGAQLEQRSAPTAYNVTTTQPITNYIPVLETAASGVARFDHNPTTFESLGLLVEQQSTNLLTYSEQFDNAAWTKAALATVTANTLIAPDGTLTMDTLTSPGYLQRTITVGSLISHTYSKYLKKGSVSSVTLQGFDSGVYWARAIFNLETGTITSVLEGTAKIENVGNGVYRCSVTGTPANVSTTVFTVPATAGDCYIWGAQLEALELATSYIPTVASQVTRAADNATMTGTNFSSWYNQGEGTFYAEFITGDSQNGLLGDQTGVSAILYSNVRELSSFNGATGLATSNLYTLNTPFKGALSYSSAGRNVVLNAGTVATTTGLIQSITALTIGVSFLAVYLNGTVKKVSYYPLRLSNTNLVALTG